MCFAIPGKVVEIEGDKVVVDYEIETREGKSLLDVKIGDYVILSGGFVIKKVPEQDAIEAIKLVRENL